MGFYRNAKARQLERWFNRMMKKYGLKRHIPRSHSKGHHKHGFKLKIHHHKKGAHKKVAGKGLKGAKKSLKKVNAKLAALRKKGKKPAKKAAKKPAKKAVKKPAKKAVKTQLES